MRRHHTIASRMLRLPRKRAPLARKEKQATEQHVARTVSHIVSVIIKVEKPEQFRVKMQETKRTTGTEARQAYEVPGRSTGEHRRH